MKPARENTSLTEKIPTNLITGFLGVGKTTAIIHLLKIKPDNEHWAVLVNEFGEIGIDGTLLKQTNAQVREVPSGCICCVGGLPMKMALNMLIARNRLRGKRPDRILIEPTGLGHPAEILASITQEDYAQVLDVRATITLVDPRKLSDARYTQHETFLDQIAVADILVANKTDLCTPEDLSRFNQWVGEAVPSKSAAFKLQRGELKTEWLDLPRTERKTAFPDAHQSANESTRLSPTQALYNPSIQLPEGQLYLRRETSTHNALGRADAFACGWLFAPSVVFKFNDLFGWLSGSHFLRVKAVMNTDQGWFNFNAESGVLSVTSLDTSGGIEVEDLQHLDSRIECIDTVVFDATQLEAELFETCLISLAAVIPARDPAPL